MPRYEETAFVPMRNLSPRERQVMIKLADGIAPKEAAFQLGITESGFYKYSSTATRKLGATDRYHAIRIVRAAIAEDSALPADAGKPGTGLSYLDQHTEAEADDASVDRHSLSDVTVDRERSTQNKLDMSLGRIVREMIDGVRPDGMELIPMALAVLVAAIVGGLILLFGSVLGAILATAASLLGATLR